MTVLTFDVDFTDYTGTSARQLDEIDACFPAIRKELERLPGVRATWFVRVDSHIEALYGSADHILRKHPDTFDWLRSRQHEIAWHHHAYESKGGEWVPLTDAQLVNAQLRKASDVARENGLTASRMGWGFHTNATMETLENLGWRVDSSALPRPSYEWDALPRDWSTTPQRPYHPSSADYRVPGVPARSILEVPLTTVRIPAPGDSQPAVIRYLNPAYRPEIFRTALSRVPAEVDPVLICHPYELLPASSKHGVLAFDIRAFRTNLELLIERRGPFSTISEMAAPMLAAPLQSS